MDGAPAFCSSPAPVGRGGETPRPMVSAPLMDLLQFCTLSVVRWDPVTIFLRFQRPSSPSEAWDHDVPDAQELVSSSE